MESLFPGLLRSFKKNESPLFEPSTIFVSALAHSVAECSPLERLAMDTRRAFSILLCLAFGLTPRRARSSPMQASCVDQLRASDELEKAVWHEAVASLRLHLQQLDASRCGDTILYLRPSGTTASL